MAARLNTCSLLCPTETPCTWYILVQVVEGVTTASLIEGKLRMPRLSDLITANQFRDRIRLIRQDQRACATNHLTNLMKQR